MAQRVGKLLPLTMRVLLTALVFVLGGAMSAFGAGTVTSIRDQEWWLSAMHAPDVMWPISTGKGIIIAEIDSGVEASHADLVGQVLPGENFSGLKGGADADIDGHGTAIASLIVGTGKGWGGRGMYGLSPGVKVLPLRVSPTGANEAVFAASFASQVSLALRFAADSDAQIINISMAQVENESTVESAIDYALAKGKLIIAGAGNDGGNGDPMEYPAAFPGVVAIGETDSAGAVASESEHGSQISFTAPGANMYGACISPSGYCTGHGTSDSTAIASASAALIWSVHPTWTADQIIRVMMNTANRGTDKFGQQDPYFGYGALRPRIALVTPGDPGAAGVNPLIPVAATQSAASQASAAAVTSPNGSTLKAGAKTGGGSASWIFVAIAVVVVIIIAVVVALILIRRRNRPGPPPSSDPDPNDPYAHLPG